MNTSLSLQSLEFKEKFNFHYVWLSLYLFGMIESFSWNQVTCERQCGWIRWRQLSIMETKDIRHISMTTHESSLNRKIKTQLSERENTDLYYSFMSQLQLWSNVERCQQICAWAKLKLRLWIEQQHWNLKTKISQYNDRKTWATLINCYPFVPFVVTFVENVITCGLPVWYCT